MRRNLVIVRAGDSSLHPSWLPANGVRNWDLLVSYYGDNPDLYRAQDIMRIDGKGPKWAGLYRVLTENRELLEKYDYIWLPDDDLEIWPSSIDRLFDLMETYKLKVGEPSLTIDSYFSWCVTLQNPATLLRWTNFIETMAPCFATSLLRECLPAMKSTISGWGLDWVWPQVAGAERRQAAIFDEICMTHTRPFGGPNYRFFKSGHTAFDEMHDTLRSHAISDPTTKIYALKSRLGFCFSGGSLLGRFVLRAGYVFIIWKTILVRNPNRWKARKKVYENLNTPDQVLDHSLEEILGAD